MTAIIILLFGVLLLVALLAALATMIRNDGYGSATRCPPGSHLPDMFDRTL